MNLPEEFLNKMKNLLGDEFNDFILSFDKKHFKGIRVNTLKIDVDEFINISPFNLEQIPWVKEGFYIENSNDIRPGKHPYYHCGLYYIQEPSAMIPVEVLDPKPGEKILDMCAAPGGKTTQIAAKLKNKGLIVTNDINPKRTRSLAKNIKLLGIKNSIITNERPANLGNKFKSYFDKILVDAPCSGEGMFKRDPKSVKNWGPSYINELTKIQRDILECIPEMLKPGGKLVYSTCTFSPEENEGTIDWFLEKYPEFEVEEIKNINYLDRGIPEFISAREDISKTLRAWPHKINGDGHYVALLRKKDGAAVNFHRVNNINKNIKIDPYLEFAKENLNNELDGELHLIGSKLFMLPSDMPDMSGLRVEYSGVLLGEIKKDRFEPSQELAMVLKKEQFKNIVNLSSNSIDAIKYLKGETLMITGEKGWRLVCIDGFPVGWGKQTQSFLKNKYKNDWRMR